MMEFTGERYIPGDKNSKDELSVEHLHRYHSVLSIITGKSVLDIACGEGYGSALMAEAAKSVVGMDISEECIIHANKAYAPHRSNLSFSIGSAEQITSPDNSFDVVVSFETIEHVSAESQILFLKEVKRVLKKDGLLVLSTPDKSNYSDRYNHVNEFHMHELGRDEFANLLGQFFTHTRTFEQGFDIVSAITSSDQVNLEAVRLIDWQENAVPVRRKYLIAVSSDQEIAKNSIASIVLETDKDYFVMVDRILQLQDEVEELGQWGRKLDTERVQHETIIRELQEQSRMAEGGQLQELTNKMVEFHQLIASENVRQQGRIEELIEQCSRQKERLEVLTTEANVRKAEMESGRVQLEQRALQLAALTDKLASLQVEIQEVDQLKLERDTLLKKWSELVSGNELLLLQKTELEAKVNDTNQELYSLEGEIRKGVVSKDQLEADLFSSRSESKEKNRLLQELQFNFALANQQLAELNNKLVTIYDSDGWKALSRYYKVKGKVLNENSWHYKVLRRTYNFVRGRKVKPGSPVPNYRLPQVANVQVIQPEEPIVQTMPYFDQPDVSIVIPVYNAWEMNVKCLSSILSNTTDIAYEVILADDGSTDMTKDIARYFQNIIHIRNEENLGFLRNCNNAASFARGRYIHFLNNDTEVKTGWLSSLVMLMDKDESIGLVGSKLIYPDGRLQEAGGIIWNDASGWNYGHGQNPDMPEFNYVKEVDYLSGASMMLRNTLWKEIGGFDTQYSPAYCEDSDLAFTVREKGLRVVYQPLSEVIHYEGYSHGSDREKSEISSTKDYQRINNRKFYDKWKDVLQKDQFPNAENVFWAKDRSRHKKTLLMVDHYVPQFDKDAGSRTTFQYLQLFVKLGYNVKFLGENFYKHEPYTTILQQMGIEVLYGPWYANNWETWFLENKEKFDYVYLNRPHISINFIDFFKENSSAKILYYGHDLHFLREEKRYELEHDETILGQIEAWKQTELYIFGKSDIILTPSVEEKNVIQKLDDRFNVQLMRPYIFQSVSSPVGNFQDRKDLLFVGGFNHSPNVDGVLWFVNEVWPSVKARIPGIKFIIAGSNPPVEIKELDGIDIVVKGYVGDAELEVLYATSKLVVIPLRYGAGVKGKTVEAMRYGLPLITTSFGIEGLPGKFSFLKAKDTAPHFADQIVALYHDGEALKKLSEQSTNYISENFTEAVAQNILLTLLETA